VKGGILFEKDISPLQCVLRSKVQHSCLLYQGNTPSEKYVFFENSIPNPMVALLFKQQKQYCCRKWNVSFGNFELRHLLGCLCII